MLFRSSLFKIAWGSIVYRRATVLLTIISIAVSVMIVLSIEHIRQQAKLSFSQTLSGTDLIVGAPSGRINLLLYSVFRMGNATNNISWKSYQTISQQKGVRWTIPISLGDSHKGYRVLGTTEPYFLHYRYGQKQALNFAEGQKFNGVYDTVLGAEVAKKLGYSIGQQVALSHGITKVSFSQHDDKPFTVVGILKPTGTPVDQTIHVSLAGIEAIHIGWENGAPLHNTSLAGKKIDAAVALTHDLTPKSITALLVGLDNRMMTFRIQRAINNYRAEPLMAVLPGVALSELWQIMSTVEKALSLIATLVVVASLLGMTTMMLSTIQQRQREVAILRAIGAPAWFLFLLIQCESLLISVGGIILGLLLLWISLLLGQPFLVENYGLLIDTNPINPLTLMYSMMILCVAMLMAFIPSTVIYRQSLAQGLSIKV